MANRVTTVGLLAAALASAVIAGFGPLLSTHETPQSSNLVGGPGPGSVGDEILHSAQTTGSIQDDSEPGLGGSTEA